MGHCLIRLGPKEEEQKDISRAMRQIGGEVMAAVVLLNHLYIFLTLRLISRDPYDFAEIQQITRL